MRPRSELDPIYMYCRTSLCKKYQDIGTVPKSYRIIKEIKATLIPLAHSSVYMLCTSCDFMQVITCTKQKYKL